MRPSLWLIFVLAFTALVYAPGLNGPFLFDDTPNLKPVADWLNGATGWQEAWFGNHSGFLGRPLSMLTFVANAKLFGMAPFSFKLTNLFIHLICGALIYGLLNRLLPYDPWLKNKASIFALLVSAIWLLHPMQVSTVLYIVQRMAQLSTLFILIALHFYVNARKALEKSDLHAGYTWLFLGVPAATVMAILCKENGVLIPLLCMVIELGYFHANNVEKRPNAINVFFVLSLGLPLLGIVAWLGLHPDWLLAGYSGRTFTLSERLLSQPRVLFQYMAALLLPRGPMLGLYNDDFLISHGWLQPPTTLLASVGLASLITLAIRTRRSLPTIFTGIAFYLVGHLIESTALPLEMVFEHRNYLPSVGFFLAISSGIYWAVGKLALHIPSSPGKAYLPLSLIALCVALGFATAARSWVWQSWSTIVEQGIQQHPNSVRAQFDDLNIVWNTGTPQQTRIKLEQLSNNSNLQTEHLAAIYMLMLDCQQYQKVPSSAVANVAAIAGSMLQLADMQSVEQVGGYLRDHDCIGLSKVEMADLLVSLADRAPQSQAQTSVWRIRFQAADLYARGGRPDDARIQAQKTWDTGSADAAAGVFLAEVQIYDHDVSEAKKTCDQLRLRIAPWDQRNLKALADLDRRLGQQ